MEPISISCKLREGRGKGPNRRLRAADGLPAVVYGHGLSEAVAISLEPRELTKALDNPKGHNALLALDVAGNKVLGLVREVQRHPSSRSITHVDIVVPNPEKEIVAEVPVKTFGRSIGVQTGGKLHQTFRSVKLAARPAEIPATVEIDVTALDHNHTVMASQMPLPEGVRPVFDRDYIVVRVLPPRGAAAEQG